VTHFQMSIEGDNAVEAVQELFSAAELSGEWEVAKEAEKEGILAVVAVIVSVVAGAVQTADIIYKWYQEYRGDKSGEKLQRVLIVGPKGERLLLEGASVEQIQKILKDSPEKS